MGLVLFVFLFLFLLGLVVVVLFFGSGRFEPLISPANSRFRVFRCDCTYSSRRYY